MKIQLLTHGLKSYKETEKFGAWHRIAFEMDKLGHKIDFLLKKDWPYFYIKYLKFKPDVIVVTGIIGYYAFKLKKLGLIKCPIILAWNDYFAEQMGKKWGISKVAKMEYYMVENANGITSPCPYLQSVGKNLGKEVFIIMHGYPQEYLNFKDKIQLNNKKRINLLYIGEQSTYKRVDELINAVNGLNCELYLIGETNESFKKNAPENVHFIGKKDYVELNKWLNSDVICIDTQDQDSSLKVIEYGFKEKAIIGLRGRKSYLFTHKEDIFLTSNFKDAITYFIKNPAEVKKIGKNAKKNLNPKSWEEVAKQHLDYIQSILNKNNS